MGAILAALRPAVPIASRCVLSEAMPKALSAYKNQVRLRGLLKNQYFIIIF